ncbi:MAG TPA: hypothetical protein VHT91_43510 [Kofleriaceae bacterium]|nr:hypothetical protein [Kofleriaceae bacterium]
MGCAEDPASGSAGYITIPLTALGAGGAIYRMPPNSQLNLSQSGQLVDVFGLDDDATSQTLQVRPGDYSVSLTDLAGDTAVWPLTRVNADGTTETVSGVLDLSSTISVVDQQTTPLVIRFHVAAIGPITFQVGAIDVSVAVDETAATAFDFTITGRSLTAGFVFVGADAPAALALRLPALDDAGDSYTVTAHTTGPWSFLVSNLLCAPVTATVSATGNQGFVELMGEATPTGFDQLCLQQVAPHQVFLFMSFFRQGPAATALLSDLGDHQYLVGHDFSAQVAADVFDGFTLDLRPLSGTHPASLAVFGNISAQSPDATSFDTWYQVDEFGDATVTLTGH